MGGLDSLIGQFSDGAMLPVVLFVAVLLGLRHATDPDHIAAVTALVAGGTERNARAGARLGLAWGTGHGLTLVALGTPFILFGYALPASVERTAEILIALVVMALALRLFLRWRAGAYHVHEHSHGGGVRHTHAHSHVSARGHAHPHRQRSAVGAFGIGVVHGAGGSAGVGILIVASIHSRSVAVVALLLLASGTGAAMAALSGGFGAALFRRRAALLPAPLSAASFAFGIWYLLGAIGQVPYL